MSCDRNDVAPKPRSHGTMVRHPRCCNTGATLSQVRASSGQSLQDANLLKLKITHGYLPKVPVVGKLYLAYLKWADPHTDDFQTKLINDGRIPVVTHATLEMPSDARL